jgi:hypothetical protein
MSGANRLETIYVELDVLLDTRLGTIARISQEAAEKTLSEEYFKRDVDDFVHVDMDQYRALYAQRDVETLKHSMCTLGMDFVKQILIKLDQQGATRPYHDGGRLVVNTYPYLLSEEERNEMGLAIAAWIDGIAPVELTYIRPEFLSPEICRMQYASMLMYEYASWINMHVKAFETVRLSTVTLFAPALYAVKPTDEQLLQAFQEGAHPMRATELLTAPLIDLRLIDAKYFSILMK